MIYDNLTCHVMASYLNENVEVIMICVLHIAISHRLISSKISAMRFLPNLAKLEIIF